MDTQKPADRPQTLTERIEAHRRQVEASQPKPAPKRFDRVRDMTGQAY